MEEERERLAGVLHEQTYGKNYMWHVHGMTKAPQGEHGRIAWDAAKAKLQRV